MNESTANDFYERIVQGTDYADMIEISMDSGRTLENIEMHPVDKTILADVIQSLPEDMFDAVEEADNPDEAEEMLEEEGGGMSIATMSSETVEAFETLVKESLRHDELTNTQMRQIIDELEFGILFELGGEIIDISFSEGGAIKDFRVQE